MRNKGGDTETFVNQIARVGGLAVVMFLGAVALIPILDPLVPDFGEGAVGDFATIVFTFVVLFVPAFGVLTIYYYRKSVAE
ncbi:hypothetical protein [Halobaculum sp. D14]|uniref:hypothetical protein n=1 Tax=Halobaculum sp. D14 TaxID=3421642 RepID=UPI003EB9D233